MSPRLSLLSTSMKVKDKGSEVMAARLDPRQGSVLTLPTPDPRAGRQEWAKPAKQGSWELRWGLGVLRLPCISFIDTPSAEPSGYLIEGLKQGNMGSWTLGTPVPYFGWHDLDLFIFLYFETGS